MNSRNWRMWLRPGMQVKRWLALFILAVTVISLGLAMGAAWLYNNFNFPKRLQPYVEWLTLQYVGHPWRELIIVAFGLSFLLFTVYKLSTSILAPVLAANQSGRDIAEIVMEERFGSVKPELNVVAIGGGTGLSALLRGLKLHDINLTAIVTVADDGGSTGRIRNVFNMPAPGDIRNCLVAMADDESLMGRLFHYRFDQEGSELTGHAFGNLIITALTQVTGSFEQGVIESAKVLNVRGRVLPSTLENITLCAEMEDGQIVRGESALSHDADKIARVFLEPQAPDGYQPAVAAILNADLIVMGPGSLYTSVIPNLLVGGIREAIRWSRASTVYVCNVATQHGETDDMGYEDHVHQIVNYLGDGELDYALINNHIPPADAIRPEWQVDAVSYDGRTHTTDGVEIIAEDVVNEKNPLRHDPPKLANVLIALARHHKATAFPVETRESA
ncbi:MAG: YvcK family protein [Thermomicrobiales bacterium]|nr:YvcK family protein [Thermomicrobiales bacterium]MCO5225516.1 YvcK family protein [Thermomicrobiales bacterium]MCO5228200.1 YvcK family protein [Thermomicrobiales bacterium]